MARDPGSLWHPLPEAGAPDGYRKTQFIVHSTGDRGTARAVADNWFGRADVVVESTFIVGLDESDPTLQLMDSSDNADANLGANQRGISVETVGKAGDPFTPWQISELVRLGRWARGEHGIPAQVCSRHDGPGFGWHVMFGAPGPWTPVAKECPGGTRIQTLKSVVFPQIFATQEDPLMALSDAEAKRLLTNTDQLVTIFRAASEDLPDGRAYAALITARDAALTAAKGNPKALADALRPYLIEAVKAGQAAGTGVTAAEVVDEFVARLGRPKG